MARSIFVVLHSLVASTIVSVPLTFVMIAVNVGFIDAFWEIYLSSLLIAIVVATPVSIAAAPAAARLLRPLSAGQTKTSGDRQGTSRSNS